MASEKDESDEDDTKSQYPPARASTFPVSVLESGGLRVTNKTPRGIYKVKGEDPTPETSEWLPQIEKVLKYKFRNPDLLEEALESPGSGVMVVGASHRVCVDGNKGLSWVGEAVMRLVAEDGCYLLKTHPKDIDSALKKLRSTTSLVKFGKTNGMDKFIRPKAPPRESKKKNPLAQIGLKSDKEETVARAVKAVFGAVYYDGGLLDVKRVLVATGVVTMPAA